MDWRQVRTKMLTANDGWWWGVLRVSAGESFCWTFWTEEPCLKGVQ